LGWYGGGKMRIVIAGGSGLIGHELSSSLVHGVHEVSILSRNPKAVTGMPVGVKIVQWDARTEGNWIKEITNSDVVIHLAGENLSGAGLFPSRWTNQRKQRLLQSRVDAGKVLAKVIQTVDRKPKLFVQASGVGIYGTDRESIFTEESVLGDDFLANLSKEWEASSESVEALGVRRVVIRTGVVLSRKGGALRPLIFPYKFFIGGPIGDGRQVYSWIHIDDVVEAIRFLIEHDSLKGVFNFSSPYPVTNSEFGKTISIVMKRPHYLPVPSFMLRLAFGEVANMVIEGQRVLPRKLLDNGYVYKYPTLDEALRNLL
jgi:uncharacterized protein (TIGR01777 family)